MDFSQRITKYSDLENNDSLSSFDGHSAQQSHKAYEVFYNSFKELKPKRVLEIGTALGGFTVFLKTICDELNLDTKILTYDINELSWYNDIRNLGVDLRVENIFNSDFTEVKEEVVDFIQEDGLTIVLCDGGYKIGEFNLLSNYIKKGDLILAHDYAKDFNFFESNIKYNVWNWCEITEKDISNAVTENELTPFKEEDFTNCAWVCKQKQKEILIHKKKEFSILLTSICFIDHNKSTSGDYVLSAHKLINDIMTKTTYDFRLITNSISEFLIYKKSSYSNRITIVEDNLIEDQLIVGKFNQLLKYKIFFGIPSEYDWILYLDCDVGFSNSVNHESIKSLTKTYYENGCDFLGTRTHFILKDQLIDHEEKIKYCNDNDIDFVPWGINSNLFSPKFVYYDVTSENIPQEWLDVKLPDEHMFYFKNSNKTELMGYKLKDFCKKYENQLGGEIITISIEAFEIGISAKMAGYSICDLEDLGLNPEWNVVYNLNSIFKKR